jgi:hypothetical protein
MRPVLNEWRRLLYALGRVLIVVLLALTVLWALSR